eukprot:scaffold182515_cov27-Tisochrysis_lutea.AAC.1
MCWRAGARGAEAEEDPNTDRRGRTRGARGVAARGTEQYGAGGGDGTPSILDSASTWTKVGWWRAGRQNESGVESISRIGFSFSCVC